MTAQPTLSAVTKVLVRMCNVQSGMEECWWKQSAMAFAQDFIGIKSDDLTNNRHIAVNTQL